MSYPMDKWLITFYGNRKSDGILLTKSFITNAHNEANALRQATVSAIKLFEDPKLKELPKLVQKRLIRHDA